MSAAHQVTCPCPTCKVDTPHNPSGQAGMRRLRHLLKVAAALFTMGFAFPNAIAGDEMPANCERCGKSVQVPYSR